METRLIFLASYLLLYCSTALAGTDPPLQNYNVDTGKLTVSGFSAGGAFATQFHVAYSSLIIGMGSWAGIANTCYASYLFNCMYFADHERASSLVKNTEDIAGRIDDVANLAADHVYIMHGAFDDVVDPDAAQVMSDYYAEYVDDYASQVILNLDVPSTHAIQSDHTGTECGTTNEELYIENCDIDSPHTMLNHILGGGLDSSVAPDAWQGELLAFDQDEFFSTGSAADASMAQTGYIYIPPKCYDSANTCLLHFHFHGCTLQAENVGTDYIMSSGFLELADANDIIVVFPQTVSDVLLGNSGGCYDWYMYTNPDVKDPLFYATQEAPQMDAVYKMMLRAASME